MKNAIGSTKKNSGIDFDLQEYFSGNIIEPTGRNTVATNLTKKVKAERNEQSSR